VERATKLITAARRTRKGCIVSRTAWRVDAEKVRLRSEHDLLQDNSEAVDVRLLRSVDRSSGRTQ